MKKVLITGCEGFIGSSLWVYLENNGFDHISQAVGTGIQDFL